MGGEVLEGDVASGLGGDAWGTLPSQPPQFRLEDETYPSGVGMAVPGAWALATPALDIM